MTGGAPGRGAWVALAAAGLRTLGLAAGCAPPDPPCGAVAGTSITAAPGGGGNVLVVLLDDVGTEQLGVYGGSLVAPTPTIDCLCARGTRFTRAWATPVCSPSRAALLTGRLGDRTGVLSNVQGVGVLPLAEQTLGEVARAAGYATGFVGKWHVDGWGTAGGQLAPQLQGFDRYHGALDNLSSPYAPEPPHDDVDGGYDHYWSVSDGVAEWVTRYATTTEIDDALGFVDAHADEDAPWLLVVALHAPHGPLTAPPAHLVTGPVPDRYAPPDWMYRATLEAADAEIGRLLRGIDPRVLADTTVVLGADNGTSAEGVAPPYDPGRVKATLYEGGIHVPLVVTGPYARPGVSDALIHWVDLVPTVAEIAGVEPPADLDGVSQLGTLLDPDGGGTPFVNTVWGPFGDLPERAIRDDAYKLIARSDGGAELYDLAVDPAEATNLLPLAPGTDPDAEAALDRLAERLAPGVGISRF
ncbi:MAG: sulfatase-like hydrolase/transferase [Myxococcota bacterium]